MYYWNIEVVYQVVLRRKNEEANEELLSGDENSNPEMDALVNGLRRSPWLAEKRSKNNRNIYSLYIYDLDM